MLSWEKVVVAIKFILENKIIRGLILDICPCEETESVVTHKLFYSEQADMALLFIEIKERYFFNRFLLF